MSTNVAHVMALGYNLCIRADVMRRAEPLLILSLLVFGSSPATATPPSLINRRVWVGPKPSDFDDRWAVSRDGRWLAFRDPASNIAIFDLRASHLRTLPVRLPDQQWRVVFAWSAGSSQLAFNRLTDHGEELVVISVDGRGQRALASMDGPVTPIGWSADARRIAVEIDHGTSVDLVWILLSTGAAERITTVFNAFRNGRSFAAVLSLDSASIAFTRITNNRSRDIFLIHADGRQESALVTDPADDYPVGYTRNGQLLFASNRSGTIDLWSMPLVPAGDWARIPKQIRRNFGVARTMAITDGGAIFYIQSQCAADVLTVTLNSDGDAVPESTKAIATRFATYNSGPDWSPLGDELVYQVGEPGSSGGIDLAFVSLRGGQEVVIHPDVLQFSRPRYTPDGKSVVVHGIGVDGVQGIYRIDRHSGKATLVARGAGEDLVNPVLRGNALFVESGGSSVQVFQGTSTMPVTAFASQSRNANFNSAPSPDGGTVAIVDGSSLVTVRIGESAREILSLKNPEQFHPFPGSLEWTADGHYILFTKVVGRERQVWRIPAGGGVAKAIGLSIRDQALYFLRTSRDGASLAFVTGDCDLRPKEVWALEHFLDLMR